MKYTPTTHADFVIEREFAASREAVFRAWADPQVKRHWSDCHAEHTTEYRLDFRPLGHEYHEVVYPDGRVQQIEKVFFDIVAAQRIVFTYDIRLDARRISVSLSMNNDAVGSIVCIGWESWCGTLENCRAARGMTTGRRHPSNSCASPAIGGLRSSSTWTRLASRRSGLCLMYLTSGPL